jgi:uncharacterized protein YcbX
VLGAGGVAAWGADIVVVSVYKLAGSPTGVGAVVVRRGGEGERALLATAASRYFSGGRAVAAVDVWDASVFQPGPAGVEACLEMGTPDLDALAAVPAAVAEVLGAMGGMDGVRAVACGVAALFRRALVDRMAGRVVVHADGGAVAQGPVVAFSVFGERGEAVGCREVRDVLFAEGVHVRAGCMCNPGACAEAVGWRVVRGEGQDGGGGMRCEEDAPDVVDGRHVGIVRASFGWASVEKDAERILDVLLRCWGPRVVRAPAAGGGVADGRVAGLRLFLVKGCDGEGVDEAAGFGGGFEGDRVYGVVCGKSGVLLNRKTAPAVRELRATGGELMRGGRDTRERGLALAGERLRERSAAWLRGGGLDAWVRRGGGPLANRGGSVHVVNAASAAAVAAALGWAAASVVDAARANVVVDGLPAWAEEAWADPRAALLVGGVRIAALQRCTRCAAMNVDGGEPLAAVVRARRALGMERSVCFGLIGTVEGDGGRVRVGDPVRVVFEEGGGGGNEPRPPHGDRCL